MKIKKITGIVLTVLAVGMVAMSGVMKLMGSAESVKGLQAVGVAQYAMMLGLAEVVFAALFAFPKTLKIGFLLLASYFAGALAVEVSYGLALNSLVPLVLIWITAAVRNPSIFLPENNSEIK